MSFSLFFGVLTLTPAVMALVILGLGLSQRARAPLALGLAALGAVVPAISLLLLAPDLSLGVPFHVALWPGAGIQHAWFAPVLRADNFGLFAAFGLVYLITPLLLWIAWRTSRVAPDAALAPDAAVEPVSAPDAGAVAPVARRTAPADLLRTEQWVGLTLGLGLEAAGLMLLFAENILWLGFAWLVLVGLVWGLGEIGTEASMLDRRGLACMVAGPVLWIGAMLLVAVPADAPRFFDLMGLGGAAPLKVFLLAITLTLAGGAYPFLVWVRRRAAFTTPAGLGAVVLVALPAAIFVGARTYSALQDSGGLWPQLGSVTPPITAGILFSLLGALTIAVCGLLALG
nr:hypothetical protein [Ktedonobacterales bacterium]